LVGLFKSELGEVLAVEFALDSLLQNVKARADVATRAFDFTRGKLQSFRVHKRAYFLPEWL
jgi:hypothetical protein